MTREEALRLADEMVTDWSGEVKNARGYVADGYKSPALQDRCTAVLRVAEFLLGPPSKLTAPNTTEETA